MTVTVRIIEIGGDIIWKDYISDRGCHREDGPATIYVSGTKEYCLNGRFSCHLGPSIIYANGTCRWMDHTQLYREDGPSIDNPNGFKIWFVHNEKISPKI